MLVDYHVHPLAHGGHQYTAARLESFLYQAHQQGLAEVGFADHDAYHRLIDLLQLAQARCSFPSLKLRLGLEVDYWPGREARIACLVSSLPLDYVIGSVHHIGCFAFDHPDHREVYGKWQVEHLYQAYYNLIALAANANLFDIIGHLDLIKIFGYRPKSQRVAISLVEPALITIRRSRLVVELNTSGLFKPAQETYPAASILAQCFRHQIPITLSSDAHNPEEVGRQVSEAAQLAWQVGYRQIATFRHRKRIMRHLQRK